MIGEDEKTPEPVTPQSDVPEGIVVPKGQNYEEAVSEVRNQQPEAPPEPQQQAEVDKDDDEDDDHDDDEPEDEDEEDDDE